MEPALWADFCTAPRRPYWVETGPTISQNSALFRRNRMSFLQSSPAPSMTNRHGCFFLALAAASRQSESAALFVQTTRTASI